MKEITFNDNDNVNDNDNDPVITDAPCPRIKARLRAVEEVRVT